MRYTVEEDIDGFWIIDLHDDVDDDGPYEDEEDAQVIADELNGDA